MKDSADRQYTEEWLQVDRPQPMYDQSINTFYDDFYKVNPVHMPNIDWSFKAQFSDWLDDHDLSLFYGIKHFRRRDVINGCTQYIDDLYQRLGPNLRTLEGDYKYHWRLNNNIKYFDLEKIHLSRNTKDELLISLPFPAYCDIHPNMNEILDACYRNNIPVHIDGAWISCCRDIEFDFNHPAIKTFAISLSKGGLGGNRIGVRFARETPHGAITIMNDYNMNSQSLMWMGTLFMSEFGPEYFWKKYESKYFKVCRDFNLEPTKIVHLAKRDGHIVGIRPLLRALS